MKELKLYIEDNGNTEFETVGDLIKALEEERQWHIRNNSIEEFLNSKIELQLNDIEGQIVFGDATLVVGSCGKRFIITGNIDGSAFDKEELK